MRFFLMPVFLCMVVMCFQASVFAGEETAYLDDSIKIMMRSGQGADYKIIAMLPLGQKITVLENEGDWVKIRTAGGTEGWVLRRFIGTEATYRIRFDELQQQFFQVSNKLGALEGENTRLHKENQEMKERLNTETGAMKSQIDKLTRENSLFKDAVANRFIKWFLAGAGVLFLGFMIGYIVKRGRRQSYFL